MRTGRAPRPIEGAVLLTACLGLVACRGDAPTAPTPPTPTAGAACAGASVVQLAALQRAVLDCSAGTTVTLSGDGAAYLVVAELAAGDVPDRAVPYVIGATGVASVADRVPVQAPAAAAAAATLGPAAGAPGVPGPGARQDAFDGDLRAFAARNLAAGRWRPPPAGAAAAAAEAELASLPPSLGSLRGFHVLSDVSDASRPRFRPVTARLSYVGNNVLLYVDTLSPANGFSAAQLTAFGQLFDQVLYPIDTNAFGAPSDIDQNGRLIMLLSPAVNALTPASSCRSDGFIAGFFTGYDLAATDTSSNRGEIFYSIAPDPGATVSCAHSEAELLRTTPAIFLHELQHLINFSQHVVVRHAAAAEDGWLDEGLSLVAEELGSRYYEQKFPPPTGRTSPSQLFPDSSQGFIAGVLGDSYRYLLRPDTASLTLHSDDENGFAWRGGDWLLLRWLGDQKGEDGFFHRLEQTTRTGIANIEAAAGESFPALFGDFGLALYTDSLPGVARTSVPSRDRFTTRNLRRLYQAYYNANGGGASAPRPFPILVTSLPPSGDVNASVSPGTMAYYRVASAAGAATLTLHFSAPGGAPLAANLHSQLSIFRLPPGS